MIGRTQKLQIKPTFFEKRKIYILPFYTHTHTFHNMDNLLTQKTPTGMVVAQTVGITASMFLFGKLPLPWVYIPCWHDKP